MLTPAKTWKRPMCFTLQSALHSQTSLQAMNTWHKLKSKLRKKRSCDLSGYDSYTSFKAAGYEADWCDTL